MRTRFSGLALLAFTVLCSNFAWGQLYTGSFTGTVLDPSGAPVTSAKITLTDVDRNTNSIVTTDGAGRYLFRSLSPGKYSIVVEADGFDRFELRNIPIEVNGSLTADAQLRLSVREENVQVQGAASSA